MNRKVGYRQATSRIDGVTESRSHGVTESRSHGVTESRSHGVTESRSHGEFVLENEWAEPFIWKFVLFEEAG